MAAAVLVEAQARPEAEIPVSRMLSRYRTWLGVLLKDAPRYLAALVRPGGDYLALCNRNERLQVASDGSGYRCEWQWTSDLHAPKVMPWLGRRLLKRALQDHPVRLQSAPMQTEPTPQVSFIIGHRGDARLPLLLKTLQSIAGQQGVAIECIVVEQDSESRLAKQLPAWVTHIHTPPPNADMPYCRSWAFNIGAKHARGELLVLHDNDLMVPSDYAHQSWNRMREGNQLINLKRFIFYLDAGHTESVCRRQAALMDQPPEAIMQNAEGGGSIVITRDAFDRIGGMDESFIGWGGEDNEFWERTQTLKVWTYGCLPLVHLWHAPQVGKLEQDNPTRQRQRTLAALDPAIRIAALQGVESGVMSGPVGWSAANGGTNARNHQHSNGPG